KELLSDRPNLLRNSKEIAEIFHGLEFDVADFKTAMTGCHASHLESLVSSANKFAIELNWHSKKTYYDQLISKSAEQMKAIARGIQQPRGSSPSNTLFNSSTSR